MHAELACIPRLLAAKIPSNSLVSFEEAAFSTLGAVALHGIRTADAKVGDVVAVIGLGLLGQITVQVLKAAGCRVVGMDIDSDRAGLALRLGADAYLAILHAEWLAQELCLQRSQRERASGLQFLSRRRRRAASRWSWPGRSRATAA